MTFERIGEPWEATHLYGALKGKPLLIQAMSWCWVEEEVDKSGLVEPGECATIEDATRLEDDDGNEIPGGLERAQLWETLAKRRDLEIPQHLEPKRPSLKHRRSKPNQAAREARADA
jgi:hypothetical protein